MLSACEYSEALDVVLAARRDDRARRDRHQVTLVRGQYLPGYDLVTWLYAYRPVPSGVRRWYEVTRTGIVMCDRDEPAAFNSRVHQTPLVSFIPRAK